MKWFWVLFIASHLYFNYLLKHHMSTSVRSLQELPWYNRMGASLVSQWVENLPEVQKTWVRSLGQGPLEKGMATHSSILAWRIPWTEELGELQSMGSQSQAWLSHWNTHTAEWGTCFSKAALCSSIYKVLMQLVMISEMVETAKVFIFLKLIWLEAAVPLNYVLVGSAHLLSSLFPI